MSRQSRLNHRKSYNLGDASPEQWGETAWAAAAPEPRAVYAKPADFLRLAVPRPSVPAAPCGWPPALLSRPAARVCTTLLATVVIHVHDPGLRGDGLGHLVGTARHRKATADVHELADTVLPREIPHGPDQEGAVGPRTIGHLRALPDHLLGLRDSP
jgi:hypothetical protein